MARPSPDSAAWLNGAHSAVAYVSQAEHHRRTALWIDAALGHGQKVYYQLTGGCLPPRIELVSRIDGLRRRRRSQFELVDTVRCQQLADGDPGRLLLIHLELIDRARRQGYQTVAFTGDDACGPWMSRRPADVLRLDREMHRLTSEPGVRALCRFGVERHDRTLLQALLRLHHGHLSDEWWSADVVEDRLVVRGEIDLGNCDRFEAVLSAATDQGIRQLDLAGVTLLSAAGLAAIQRVASRLALSGARLVLPDVPPLIVRLLRLAGLAGHPGLDMREQRC